MIDLTLAFVVMAILVCVRADMPSIECEDEQSAETLAFEDCGSEFDVTFLKIPDCTDQQQPCIMPTNSTVTMVIKFGNNLEQQLGDGDSEDKWKFQHEAFWMLNEVETPADISSYIIVHCNQTPMMEVTLHTGDMVADIPGTLRWKVFKDETMVACLVFEILLEVRPPQDPEEPPLPEIRQIGR